jgi:phage/plasmid-like protein (TIGR03299 family)
MSAELYEHDTLFSVRRIPWHGLGEILESNPQSAVEAIVAAGLDWQVDKKPVYVDDKVAKGYKANVRQDTGEVLGIVTDKYKIVQNSEAFGFADYLLGDAAISYETAGSLRNGRTVWALLNLPEYNLLGDKMASYLLLSNTHDGTAAIKVATVSVRVVCNNTLNAALSGATRFWSILHRGDVGAKMEDASRSLALHGRYIEKLKEEADKLVHIAFTAGQFEAFVERSVYPYPDVEDIGKIALAHLESNREDLCERFEAADLGNFRETKWAGALALSDHFYHYKAGKDRMKPLLFGNDKYDTAYGALLVA